MGNTGLAEASVAHRQKLLETRDIDDSNMILLQSVYFVGNRTMSGQHPLLYTVRSE
jgi:hypothetical protein